MSEKRYNLRPRPQASAPPPAKRQRKADPQSIAEDQSTSSQPPVPEVIQIASPSSGSDHSSTRSQQSSNNSPTDGDPPSNPPSNSSSSSDSDASSPSNSTSTSESVGNLSSSVSSDFGSSLPTGSSHGAERFYIDVGDFKCESLGQYDTGGLAPIQIGSGVDHDRYEVCHKLGWGARSTVWLAYDHREKRHVALKVLTARNTKHCGLQEVQKHMELKRRLSKEDYDTYIVPLLDWAVVGSENGRHLVLVLGLSGPSIRDLSEEGRQIKIRPDYARHLARQAALGMQKLHAAGIVWGDASAYNFVLRLTNIDDWPDGALYERLGEPDTLALDPSDQRQGTIDFVEKHSPEHLVKALDFSKDNRWQYLEPHVQFIDFEEMRLVDAPAPNNPSQSYTPGYGDPQVSRMHEGLTRASDVYALACIFYELRTGEMLHPGSSAILGKRPRDFTTHSPPHHPRPMGVRRNVPWKEKAILRDNNYGHFWPGVPRFILMRKLAAYMKMRYRHLRGSLPCPQNLLLQIGRRCGLLHCYCRTCAPIARRNLLVSRKHLKPATMRQRLAIISYRNLWNRSTIAERTALLAKFENAVGANPEAPRVPRGEELDTGAPPPVGFSKKEASDFEDVLMMMLTWWRDDRASLEQVLEMPWLDVEGVKYDFDNGNAKDKQKEEEPWCQGYSEGMEFEWDGKKYI